MDCSRYGRFGELENGFNQAKYRINLRKKDKAEEQELGDTVIEVFNPIAIGFTEWCEGFEKAWKELAEQSKLIILYFNK